MSSELQVNCNHSLWTPPWISALQTWSKMMFVLWGCPRVKGCISSDVVLSLCLAQICCLWGCAFLRVPCFSFLYLHWGNATACGDSIKQDKTMRMKNYRFSRTYFLRGKSMVVSCIPLDGSCSRTLWNLLLPLVVWLGNVLGKSVNNLLLGCHYKEWWVQHTANLWSSSWDAESAAAVLAVKGQQSF